MFVLGECYPTDNALYKAFKGGQTKGTSNVVGYISSFVVAWYEHYVLKLYEGERLWERCRDENNELYYHNKKTGATVREKPEDIDALLHDMEEDEEYSDEDDDGLSELPSGDGTPGTELNRKQSRKQSRKPSRKVSAVPAKPSRKPSAVAAKPKKTAKTTKKKKGK
jgi:hypothetical protein